MSYTGYVRVIDANENILDVAEVALDRIDHQGHTWGGTLKVSAGGALDGKTLPIDLEVPDAFRASALLVPGPSNAGITEMTVLGIGDSPFAEQPGATPG